MGGLAAAGLLFYVLAIQAPAGPRSVRVFDPDRLASLELEMWQAYYRKEKVQLFRLLVTMLREQYRYPWVKAASAGYHLARAAAVFGDTRSDYERVLPDLEVAYGIAKDWTGAGYDPAAVARAELGWWVARRTPGQNSPESVGERMADLYALYYEVPRERVQPAALLRARAAALRDSGGDRADWPEVSRILQQSFRSLAAAVQPIPGAAQP